MLYQITTDKMLTCSVIGLLTSKKKKAKKIEDEYIVVECDPTKTVFKVLEFY